MNDKNIFDIVVIGGGAAGMTAALYSLRSGKKVLLIEKETIGGQISKSPRVENFPSIKEISGTEFSDKMFGKRLSKSGISHCLRDLESYYSSLKISEKE